MKVGETQEYRYSDTTWGKYDSGFHAFMVETCDPDNYFGDTDFGGVALYGKRLDVWTSTGFHSLSRFATAEGAEATYQREEDEYYKAMTPDSELVSEADYGRMYRTGMFADVVSPFWHDDRVFEYSRAFGGVAVRVFGPAVLAVFEPFGEVSEYVPVEGAVMVHMVGDDSLYRADLSDLVVLSEDEYCSGCGQLGCKAEQ